MRIAHQHLGIFVASDEGYAKSPPKNIGNPKNCLRCVGRISTMIDHQKGGGWGCLGQQSAANTFNGRLIPANGEHKPIRYQGEEPNSINKVRKTKRFYWAYDRDTVNVTVNSSRLGARSIAFCCSNLIAACRIRFSTNLLAHGISGRCGKVCVGVSVRYSGSRTAL